MRQMARNTCGIFSNDPTPRCRRAALFFSGAASIYSDLLALSTNSLLRPLGTAGDGGATSCYRRLVAFFVALRGPTSFLEAFAPFFDGAAAFDWMTTGAAAFARPFFIQATGSSP